MNCNPINIALHNIHRKIFKMHRSAGIMVMHKNWDSVQLMARCVLAVESRTIAAGVQSLGSIVGKESQKGKSRLVHETQQNGEGSWRVRQGVRHEN